MKRILYATAFGLISPSALAVCNYPLDATASELATINGNPFPSVNGQSVYYTTPEAQNGITYLAMSGTGANGLLTTGGDIPVMAGVINAIELEVDQFPSPAPLTNYHYSNNSITFGLATGNTTDYLNPAANYAIIQYGIEFNHDRDGIQISVFGMSHSANSPHIHARASYPLPLMEPLPSNYRLGLYIDGSTRQVGITANGNDLGYLLTTGGTAFTLPAALPSLSLLLQANPYAIYAGDPLIGAPVSASLITDGALMTQPHPTGAKDICGYTTGQSVVLLPNRKAFPGKGHAYGLMKNK